MYQVSGPLTPIPTLYAGYLMRSRLEARWAVFLTALRLRWRYEPEGYPCNGTGYLPDFLVTTLHATWGHPDEEDRTVDRVFLEVKPCGYDRERDAWHAEFGSAHPLLVVAGSPPGYSCGDYWADEDAGVALYTAGGVIEPVEFVACGCGAVQVRHEQDAFDGAACPRCGTRVGYGESEARVERALVAARRERFGT